jgi:hypothetical protein
MSKESSGSSSSGIGFTGLLAVAFIVLKLCKVINWSWWWVLSPIWIPVGLLIIGLLVYVCYLRWKSNDEKKRLASGMNQWAWDNRKKNSKYHGLKEPVEPIVKSKWQQRFEEMEKRQRKKM